MKLELANINDAVRVCELLNLAYRGPEGWTTESALVEGNRCSESDIISDIKSPNNYLLVYKTSRTGTAKKNKKSELKAEA